MNLKTYLISLICLCFFIQAKGQNQAHSISEKIDSLFDGWTDNTKPGISVSVLNKGKIEHSKSWGLANLEHEIPVSNKTVFLFPHMSEQLLAFSILLLEERGLLSLEDKLSKYFDGYSVAVSNITIGQLLHHNSPLQNLETIKLLAGLKKEDVISREDFSKLLQLDLATKENVHKDHNYNKAGLRLLQLVLEKQTSMDFKEFATTEIFAPMGMQGSSIASSTAALKHKAQGYSENDAGYRLENEEDNYLIMDQLYATTHDLLLWVDNFWRAKVGSKTLWKKMDGYVHENGQPQKEKNQALFLGQHRFWDYRGTAKIYQIGVSSGYGAKIVRYQKQELAIIVMGNLGKYNGHLATASSEFYMEPFFKPTSVEAEKPLFIKMTTNELAPYCGQYWDYDGESLAKVTLEDDTLRYFDEKYNWKTDLLPLSEGRFFIDARTDFEVEFVSAKGGRDLVLHFPEKDKIFFSEFKQAEKRPQTANEYAAVYSNEALQVHYEIVATEEGLELRHRRGGTVPFVAMQKDEYKSNNRLFSRIKFMRDDKGNLIGMQLSNPKFKKLYFKKSKEVIQ